MPDVVAFLVFVTVCFWLAAPGRYRFWTRLRGAPDLKSSDEANQFSDQRMAQLKAAGQFSNALPILFGLLRVPLEVLSKPLVIIGLPGTGKTTLINMIMASAFQLFNLHRGRTRFVFLDIKNELPARLNAQVPSHVPIYHLNPLDQRAVVLNYPQIFPNRSDIDQLAHSICPPIPGDQNPFFRDCARQAIALVAKTLQKFHPKATRPWGLYDLCSTLADKRQLRRVMSLDFEARTYYTATLGTKNKAAGDVFSTIRSVIQPLIPAALAELDNPKRLILPEFVRDDGIAVLGVPPKGSQAVLPIYGVLLRRLIEEAQTIQHPEDRLFIVLDEIAMLNRSVVDSIVKAACVGRSHGIHVIAATQSIELLEAQFGTDQAQAFLASCATTIGFRSASRKTAEYIVGRMGKQEGLVVLVSCTYAKEGSTTYTQHLQMRDAVLVEDLLHAPLADPINDSMTFWGICPTFGNFTVTCPFVAETTVEADPQTPNTLPRPESAKSLRPFTSADWVALGLPECDLAD
jgi:hypothetical protein